MARMNGLVTYLLPTIQPAAGRQSPRTTRVGFSYLQMRRLRVLRILRDLERKGRCQGETRVRLDAARRRQTKSRQRPWYRPCSSVTQS